MRLIDADELIHLYFDDENGNPIFDFVPWEFVENAPTIEAEPVKHGRWETPKGYPNVLLCSECNTPYEKKEFVATQNYCPNCGAQMMDEVEE